MRKGVSGKTSWALVTYTAYQSAQAACNKEIRSTALPGHVSLEWDVEPVSAESMHSLEAQLVPSPANK
jgi:hypothetical protein